MELEVVGFLKDGKYRIQILKELNKTPLLPSEIAEKLGLHRSSVSRILNDMKKWDLIKSASKNSRTIIYSITKKGKKNLEELK